MAKETKAERTVREAAVREAMMEEARVTYPARLLAMLERAQDANFELRVMDSVYVMYDRDERDAKKTVLFPWYSDGANDTLSDFAWDVQFKEEETLKAERKFLAKQTALAKLSKEEKELLGL